jgi:hypothetical protein
VQALGTFLVNNIYYLLASLKTPESRQSNPIPKLKQSTVSPKLYYYDERKKCYQKILGRNYNILKYFTMISRALEQSIFFRKEAQYSAFILLNVTPFVPCIACISRLLKEA